MQMKWKGHRFTTINGVIYLAWRDQDIGLYWAIPTSALPEAVCLEAAKKLHPWRRRFSRKKLTSSSNLW